MKNTIKSLIAVSLVSTMIGCAAPTTAHLTEFGSVASVGETDTSNMSRQELHASIQKARLDGQLTAEQARKAHMQLDVKGHLTQEQMAVITRDRLAKRDAYETRKEQLDVVRDTAGTGTSVTSDVFNTLQNIKAIFR